MRVTARRATRSRMVRMTKTKEDYEYEQGRRKSVADWLDMELKRRGMLQIDLALKTGVSASFISQVIRQRASLSSQKLIQIKQYFKENPPPKELSSSDLNSEERELLRRFNQFDFDTQRILISLCEHLAKLERKPEKEDMPDDEMFS